VARKFSAKPIKVLKEATEDAGYRYLRAGRDLPMLLAFLERFDHLGWFPPLDLEKQRLLAAHDVIMHAITQDLCFYEFLSRGARDEREPWLEIFFHVDEEGQIRICGIEDSRQLARRRSFYLDRIHVRVTRLHDWLEHHKES